MKSATEVLFWEEANVSDMVPWIAGQRTDIRSTKSYTLTASVCAGIESPGPFSKQTMLFADLKDLVLYNCLALQGNTDTTSQIEMVLSQLSMKKILIPKPEPVRDYLLRYPGMTDILVPLCQELKERFGESAQLSLELYRDLEIEDKYLVFYVRQEDYDVHILDAIEDVSKEFEIELSGRPGYLLITSDFRAPR